MSDYGIYDDYDPDRPATLEEATPSRRRRRRSRGAGQVYNAAAFLFFALAGAVVVLTAFLVLDPARAAALIPAEWRAAAPIAPPLPTTQPAVEPPAADPTLAAQGAAPAATEAPESETSVAAASDATAAPDGTATPTPTRTPRPSATPQVGILASDATQTPQVYPFEPVEAPRYTAHSGPEGCDYLAIAGQVYDENGRSLLMVPVIAEGDAFFSSLDFSGNAPRYGASGYEIFINDRPYEDAFTIRLVSETGVALSDAIEIRTSDSCAENVVIVDFRATAPLED